MFEQKMGFSPSSESTFLMRGSSAVREEQQGIVAFRYTKIVDKELKPCPWFCSTSK